MSFLTRIASRSGIGQRMPHIRPKGFAGRGVPTVYRQSGPEEEEEEMLQPARASGAHAPGGALPSELAAGAAAQVLRRATAGAPAEEDEEETLQPLRRAVADAAPEEEDEESLQPLRRSTDLMPEVVSRQPVGPAPVHRTAGGSSEEEEEESMQPLRRESAAPRGAAAVAAGHAMPAAGRVTGAGGMPAGVLDSTPVVDRTDTMPAVGAAPWAEGTRWDETGSDETGTDAPSQAAPPAPASPWLPPRLPERAERAAPPAPSAAVPDARPDVTIDHIDVLIHEPAPAPQAPSRSGSGRALRARYLRRL